MVRPRLVEEGKPLPSSSSSAGLDADHPAVFMEEGSNSSHNNGINHQAIHHSSISHHYVSHVSSNASSLSDGGRDVLSPTAAAAAASNAPPQSTSTSSLLKALARTTHTDARQSQQHTAFRQPSSQPPHRTVIGEHRGEITHDSVRAPLSHQHHYSYQQPDPIQPYHTSDTANFTRPHKTHYEIGRMEEEEEQGRGSLAEHDDDDVDSMDDEMSGSDVVAGDVGLHHVKGTYRAAPDSPVRMEGVEDHSVPVPLVVMDGANVAYEYGGVARTLREGIDGGGSTDHVRGKRGTGAATADARGMLVASEYFVKHGVRVKVVLPASWFRRKPAANDPNRSNARMQTDEQDALAELQRRGLLVASPPADDDDAYAIALARRESARTVQRCRALHQHHHHLDPSAFPIGRMGGAFVLSNDLFRDAQDRDPTLRSWLTVGEGSRIGGPIDGTHSSLSHTSSTSGSCPGRISYTFVDVGTMDDHGDPQLDFLPNPRHPLISWLEERLRSQPL